ncbi:hypothetical protein ACWDPF_29055 [Streptomyces albogriseolus]
MHDQAGPNGVPRIEIAIPVDKLKRLKRVDSGARMDIDVWRTVMQVSVHQEFDVTVTAVAPVGSKVAIDGGGIGFIDQVKHPSWWDVNVAPPQIGDRLHVVVLDLDRDPPRLSALRKDMDIARRLTGRDAPARDTPDVTSLGDRR